MKNDGGPAFGGYVLTWKRETVAGMECSSYEDAPVMGMSLRDYFAAAALQGQLSMHTHAYSAHDFLAPDVMSKRAYQYADAMLAEREKP